MAQELSKRKYKIKLFKTIPGKKEVEWEVDRSSPIGKSARVGANWKEPFLCSECEEKHPIIHVLYQRARGRVGEFKVFFYGGELHMINVNHPKGMNELPSRSKKLSQKESEKIWHSKRR